MPTIPSVAHPIHDHRRRDAPTLLVAVVAGIVAVATVASALRAPRTIDRLTIANPTSYGIAVSMRAGPADGRFLLGFVWDHDEGSVADVADLGDTWIFEFSYAGVDAGELRLDRSALQDTGWRVDVPASVAQRLSALGLQPAYGDPAVVARHSPGAPSS